MNLKLFSVIFCALSTGFAQTRTPQEIVEQKCGVELREPAQRVFAKVDDKQPWKEFGRVADVPELSLGFGTSAEMWSGRNHGLLIRTEEPGEDFDANTEYCFGQGGKLVQVAYEIRTAWGWGFRMNGNVLNGALHTDSKVYFNTETGKRMLRPEGADDIREALRPSLFLTVNQLPFSQLLSK
ncbi:MAG TPA: hypothetical protein VMD29_05175 [Terracidiphilus sp.]|nr:hypothetical protein [Terracidiphilus sp.]